MCDGGGLSWQMWLAYENAAARFLDTVPVEEQDRMRARIKPTPNHISGKVNVASSATECYILKI